MAGNRSVKCQNHTEFPIVHLASWPQFWIKIGNLHHKMLDIYFNDCNIINESMVIKCLMMCSRKVKSDRINVLFALTFVSFCCLKTISTTSSSSMIYLQCSTTRSLSIILREVLLVLGLWSAVEPRWLVQHSYHIVITTVFLITFIASEDT